MQLINHDTAEGGQAALLRHAVYQVVGLLNGAHYHSCVGFQHTGGAFAAIVALDFPACNTQHHCPLHQLQATVWYLGHHSSARLSCIYTTCCNGFVQLLGAFGSVVALHFPETTLHF